MEPKTYISLIQQHYGPTSLYKYWPTYVGCHEEYKRKGKIDLTELLIFLVLFLDEVIWNIIFIEKEVNTLKISIIL